MQNIRYEILLKTIELGNVTRSAEFFGYTQSAVSQILSSIERDLGLKLLKRHRAGIELTAEGMSLLPFMTTICSDITALKEAASNLKLGISGLIKIGSFQSVACYMLPPLIRGFQSIYPKVHFDIKEGILSDIEKLLGNGEIDIGFVSIQNLSKFDAIKLKDDRLNVVLQNLTATLRLKFSHSSSWRTSRLFILTAAAAATARCCSKAPA